MYIVPVVCVTISTCGYWSSTKAFSVYMYIDVFKHVDFVVYIFISLSKIGFECVI